MDKLCGGRGGLDRVDLFVFGGYCTVHYRLLSRPPPHHALGAQSQASSLTSAAQTVVHAPSL